MPSLHICCGSIRGRCRRIVISNLSGCMRKMMSATLSWRARIIVSIFFAGLLCESYFEPHYAAPMTCVLLTLTLMAMRRLQAWQPNGRPVGAALNRTVVVVCLLSFVVRGVAAGRGWEMARSEAPAWHQVGPKSFGRAALVAKLKELAGKQLVIVRYTGHHELFDEWVYNDADINGSKIVWAREMDAAENAKLVDYFKDRQVRLLDADKQPPELSPYPKINGARQVR